MIKETNEYGMPSYGADPVEEVSLDQENLESSKKLSISQKLFKLRYLSKCHLQLCAV
jgi:hypothetical protein